MDKLLVIFMIFTLQRVHAENIDITTSSPAVKAEKDTDLDENKLINAVESYLAPVKNVRKTEPQDQPQGYMTPMYPIYPAYNTGGYFYPGVNPNAVAQPDTELQSSSNYFSAVIPVAKAALQAGLKVFAKLGLFLMGGAGLLAIGGIFMTLVCYLTPVCTLTFNGYDFQKALDKETMRSLMTPEKIASAAALVQDAIGKYQRLQRAASQ